MTGIRQKLYSLQILRGLAAVWVVVFHLEFLAVHYFHDSQKFRLVHAGQLGVHLFFILSGFIIFWIHDPDAGKADPIRAYFLKRITRIYPLLLVLNIVKLAYMGLSGYGVRENKFDLSSVLGSFLLLPTTTNFLIDVTWSLTYEIWFYLGFGILLLLGRNTLCRFGLGYGLLIIILNLPGLPSLEGMADFVFNPRILEFILGCVIAFGLRWHSGPAKSTGFLFLTLGAAVVAIGLYNALDETLPFLPDCAYWGTAFGLLLSGCLLLERSFDFSKPRLGILMGDASYSIYLAHSLTLNALAVVFQKLFPGAAGTALFLILFVCGLLSLVSGVACYFWLERPMHRFSRKWVEQGQSIGAPFATLIQTGKPLPPSLAKPEIESNQTL